MEISNFLSKYHLSGSDSGSKSKIYEKSTLQKNQSRTSINSILNLFLKNKGSDSGSAII